MEAPNLKRGLGYTSESVHLVLADLDRVAQEASEHARAAETLVLELRSEAERLRSQLAERTEEIRALGAEAAELRTERDAAHHDLEEAVTDAARLRLELLELTTTIREMETVQRGPGTSGPEIGTAPEGSDLRDERLRAGGQLGAGQGDEMALLRQELRTARRDFVIQSQRTRSAEARIEELEGELRSVRAELEAGLSAAAAELEAARAILEQAAERAAEPPITAEEPEPARAETTAEVSPPAEPRDRLAPPAGVARSATGSRGRAAGNPVGDAVAPLTQAISELSGRLGSLGRRSGPSREATGEPPSEGPPNPIDLEDQGDRPRLPDPPGEASTNGRPAGSDTGGK